ncbi:MAG: hypothetical protein J3R72DRAFT_453830 [Linnemannia gamsii]|nr:MAG: hypothetical protein J3R72DRAFT_453830 [Linnemannia gamsii]
MCIANGLSIVTIVRVIVSIIVGILALVVDCRGAQVFKVLAYCVPLFANYSNGALSVLWSVKRETIFKNLWNGESEMLREGRRCVDSVIALDVESYQ